MDRTRGQSSRKARIRLSREARMGLFSESPLPVTSCVATRPLKPVSY